MVRVLVEPLVNAAMVTLRAVPDEVDPIWTAMPFELLTTSVVLVGTLLVDQFAPVVHAALLVPTKVACAKADAGTAASTAAAKQMASRF
ncbi:MAG: hypothetical protein EBR28_08195 [Planctomycetia bacterium]|nr:hypothetical protein [Planctomycetia bacterium]